MTRTDRRGRPLKAFLQAEIAGADVTIEEMRKACGLTRASYYGEPSGTGRGFDDSFPNSEELRQVAEHYKLGENGWVSLVEFGWLQPVPGTLRMPYTAESPTNCRRRRSVSSRFVMLCRAIRMPRSSSSRQTERTSRLRRCAKRFRNSLTAF